MKADKWSEEISSQKKRNHEKVKTRRKACKAEEKWGGGSTNKGRGRGGEREPVSGRREWDMSQAYSINTRLPHPCLIVLFIHYTH